MTTPDQKPRRRWRDLLADAAFILVVVAAFGIYEWVLIRAGNP